MTVTAFITAIDADYPNAFTSAQKVAWLNRAKTELYKWAGIEAVETIATVAGTAEYDLDPTIEFEQIHFAEIETSAGGATVQLFPKARGEVADRRCYFKSAEGKISFYPTPATTGLDITLYFTKKPADYASDVEGLAAEIALTDDGLIAAQDYVIAKMAMANDDIDKANNYRLDYNAKKMELMQLKYKRIGKYPTTRNMMKATQKTKRLNRIGHGDYSDLIPS